MARRPQLLVLALVAVGAWTAMMATSTLFVGSQAQSPSVQLRGNTAMAAAKVKDGELLAIPPNRKFKSNRLMTEFSTGASNKVAIITPPISSEGVQEILSINIYFFFAIAMLTSGALIEIQRFFPDATYF
eukprot:TRINITY_DN464_c0_g3_i1.p2 TRINITY_DN464_c0_g3~~TRINITY_DN464_c0_g3_i1.p2  ORF type:complete len:130 (+),score=33.20 TRINITY_DN464_c0_g3_i1:82-471(+)